LHTFLTFYNIGIEGIFILLILLITDFSIKIFIELVPIAVITSDHKFSGSSLLLPSSEIQMSKVGLTRLSSWCTWGCIPSQSSRADFSQIK
jgi:hypothetical protein